MVPDGPLAFCLLACVRALLPALLPLGLAAASPWRAWLLAGLFLGLAGLSKYTAVLMGLGLIGFIATSPRHRHWLGHPAPFAGALAALAVVSPVPIWNLRHDWLSFAFQTSRGLPRAGVHPGQVLAMAGGELALLSPWVAVPLVIALASACRRGAALATSGCSGCPCRRSPSSPPRRFGARAACPIGPMPGWLFVFPLLALRLADGRSRWIPAKAWALVSAPAFLAVVGAGVALAVCGPPWRPKAAGGAEDATLESFAWTALPASAAVRDMHPRFSVATRWMDAGKIAMAFGPAMPVFVFSGIMEQPHVRLRATA